MFPNLGRTLLSVVAVFTAVSAAFADLNAAFLGAALGATALLLIWRGKLRSTFQLRVATWLTGVYVVAFLPASLTPVAALACLTLTVIGYRLARAQLRRTNLDLLLSTVERLQRGRSGLDASVALR